MATSEAESSSQALERYLAAQLVEAKLTVPSDDVEYMARFIEEDGLEEDEKMEGVRGMLEGVVEDVSAYDLGVLPDDIDAILRSVISEWDRLRAEAAAAAAEAESPSSSTDDPSSPLPPEPSNTKPELSEKEIAKLHAMRYAYVESDLADLYIEETARPGGAPPRGQGLSEAEAKKAAEERKAQVMSALKLDGKKKKYKKQQEVDLLAPNLNRDKVNMLAQMQRHAQKKSAQTVRDRDKAALDKQRADQAKAKADKQKKAAKQERRG